MSGCSLSAGGTSSWPSGRIPDIEKLDVGLPSDHGRVRTFCQPDDRSDKMERNIRGSKWPSRQGARRRDLPAHLNETRRAAGAFGEIGPWRGWLARLLMPGPILCVLAPALMGA
jgi:hypothetical protein